MPSLAQGRKNFIGGSDARIIMGNDEAALLRLWREKRGGAEPEDLSGNLVVQLGVVTKRSTDTGMSDTGQVVTAVQRRVQHPVVRFLAATLDGKIEGTGAVFDPSSCSHGRSLKRRRRKSTSPRSSTTCG